MNIINAADDSHRRIASVGMFDGVHCGHRYLIGNIKAEASKRRLRSAVITFRNHPLSIISPHASPLLLSTLDERLELLASTGIDDCILLDFNNPLRNMPACNFLSMLHNSYGIESMIIGFNNRFGHNRSGGIEEYRKIGQSLGIDIIIAQEFLTGNTHISSSTIRLYISEGNIKEANKALGYNYFITGTVTEGKRLGRTIGFPTANVTPTDSLKLIPKPGVYAALISVGGEGISYKAMVNIGYRPTVDNSTNPHLSIEAHIMDFSNDIYNRKITVEFLDYVRQEQPFDSLESLKKQLLIDRKNIEGIISKDFS